jgi:hypothetical protein
MADASGSKKNKIKKTAEALVAALQTEMQFPVPMTDYHKEEALKTWYAKAPERSEFKKFQIHSGMAAPMAVLGPQNSDSQDLSTMEEIFCSVHGDFVLVSGTDIEHGLPYALIKNRQQQLLDFLNSSKNSEITNGLLQNKQMQGFFRRNPQTKAIEMSRYFGLICYNNIKNLWLMCHACNTKKNNKDPIKWFRDQKYFGDDFIKDIEQKGGVCRGIIFDQIGGKLVGAIEMGKGSTNIYAGGTGLGAYANQWFKQHRGEIENLYRVFHNEIQRDLRKVVDTAVLKPLKEGQPDKARAGARFIKKATTYMAGAMQSVMQYVSEKAIGSTSATTTSSSLGGDSPSSQESGSDNEQQKELRRIAGKKSHKAAKTNIHYFKKIEEFLLQKYPQEKAKVNKFLYESAYTEFFTSPGTEPEVVKELCRKIKRKVAKSIEKSSTQNQLEWSELKKYIKAKIDGEVNKVPMITQQLDKEEQEKEAETKRADIAEQLAEAEAKARRKAEQRVMELELQASKSLQQKPVEPSQVPAADRREMAEQGRREAEAMRAHNQGFPSMFQQAISDTPPLRAQVYFDSSSQKKRKPEQQQTQGADGENPKKKHKPPGN